MSGLANQLGRLPEIGRPVLDDTHLADAFDYQLTYDPEPAGAAPSDLPSIFVALEDQLGLRLVRTNSNVSVLVVDRVERPTEN